MTRLGDRFAVQRRFFRSVHVAHDTARPDACEGYVLTPLGRATLRRVLEGLDDGGTARAWTLTGPYGAGKSAFVVLLAQLLGRQGADGAAMRAVRGADRELARRVEAMHAQTTGFCPVLVSGTYGPLLPPLLDAIERAAREMFRPSARQQQIVATARSLRSSRAKVADLHKRVVGLVEDLVALTCDRGGGGVLLVIDELGKTLEHAARSPGRADEVFLLQELAEAAARSGPKPMALVTLLHQSFDRYARELTTETRAEWTKVQGRFDDVAFLDAPGELLRLAARAIVRRDGASAEFFAPYDARVDAAVALGLCDAELAPTLRHLAPLHPTAALVLPALFRGPMAQNERSLFGFLTSSADGAFGGFLAGDVTPDAPAYTLDLLYDYVTATLGPAQFTGPAGRRWAAIDEAVARLPRDASPLAARVVKAVGLLGLLGSRSVRASRDALRFALASTCGGADEVGLALDALAASSQVVYRRHSDAYALWEGSDVDLDAHFDAARRKATGVDEVSAILQARMVLRPWVARRHFIETGTLRYFDVSFTTARGAAAAMEREPGGADGQVLYLLPDGAESHRDLVGAAVDVAQPPDVVVGVPREARALLDGARDWCAWESVRGSVADLAHDPVARRELAARAHFAEARLDAAVQACFGLAEGAAVAWVHRGAATDWRGTRGLSAGLSAVCDQRFCEAPRIRNELLNRRALSSAAAAARRALLDAMLSRAATPGLGIEGTPPERSMYESVLAQGGLHRVRDGAWGFGPPPDDDPLQLWPAWRCVEAFFDTTEHGARPLRELFAALGRAPVGMREGPIPVLFFAVVLSAPGEVALFEEGSFVPEVTDAVVERMLRRVDHFSVARHRLEGPRRAVVRALWAALGVADGNGRPVELTRAIVRRVGQLPRYSRNTRALGAQAMAARDAVMSARDPLRLLFDDLPRALGLGPVTREGEGDGADYAARLGAALDELSGVYPRLLTSIERRVGDRFGVAGEGAALRASLGARAKRLLEVAVDLRLRAFLGRAAEADAGRAEWVEGLAMVVGNRPPSEWSDAEFARFEVGLGEVHALFARAENLAGVARPTMHDDDAPREILRMLEDRLGPRREAWVAALGRALESLGAREEDTP